MLPPRGQMAEQELLLVIQQESCSFRGSSENKQHHGDHSRSISYFNLWENKSTYFLSF